MLPYFAIQDGMYDDKRSRWNKIDSRTSLLDANGHISGQGGTGQDRAAILINYICNETLSHSKPADAQASVTGCLAAMRKAAPETVIVVLVPPGLADKDMYPGGAPYLAALRDGVADYRKANPADKKLELLDLGPEVAHALASPGYAGGVHPTAAGHAYLAPMIRAALLRALP